MTDRTRIDDAGKTPGDVSGRTRSEDARRYYLERGGTDARAGETLLARSTGETRVAARAGHSEHASGTAHAVETPTKSAALADADRALGEQPHAGSDGPHILERSFSGTYTKE